MHLSFPCGEDIREVDEIRLDVIRDDTSLMTYPSFQTCAPIILKSLKFLGDFCYRSRSKVELHLSHKVSNFVALL